MTPCQQLCWQGGLIVYLLRSKVVINEWIVLWTVSVKSANVKITTRVRIEMYPQPDISLSQLEPNYPFHFTFVLLLFIIVARKEVAV